MDLLGQWCLAVSRRLGISVVAPAKVELKSGFLLDVSALFPQFGAANGMVVVERSDTIAGHHDELIDSGYGFSCFNGSESGETDDLESVMEMFRDWGWSDTGIRAPDWLGSCALRH